MKVQANGIEIEVQDSGVDGWQADRPVLLLIMGLGMQLVGWPEGFVGALVDAGYRVVRHDNRDIGLSQGFDDAPQRNLLWEGLRSRLGWSVRAPYSLQDMAQDSLGVLDALGIARAHIIGASMGGMIAQRVAATAPERALSLVSIMSSSGARGLPGPQTEVLRGLMRPPPSVRSEEALLAYSLEFLRLIASPAFPDPEQATRERVRMALRRAYHPSGLLRQMLAVAADSDRAEQLARIRCPTLVLHGEADRLVPVECGRDTAQRIQGARFIGIPGMGHDFAPGVVQRLLGHILPFLESDGARA